MKKGLSTKSIYHNAFICKTFFLASRGSRILGRFGDVTERLKELWGQGPGKFSSLNTVFLYPFLGIRPEEVSRPREEDKGAGLVPNIGGQEAPNSGREDSGNIDELPNKVYLQHTDFAVGDIT